MAVPPMQVSGTGRIRCPTSSSPATCRPKARTTRATRSSPTTARSGTSTRSRSRPTRPTSSSTRAAGCSAACRVIPAAAVRVVNHESQTVPDRSHQAADQGRARVRQVGRLRRYRDCGQRVLRPDDVRRSGGRELAQALVDRRAHGVCEIEAARGRIVDHRQRHAALLAQPSAGPPRAGRSSRSRTAGSRRRPNDASQCGRAALVV